MGKRKGKIEDAPAANIGEVKWQVALTRTALQTLEKIGDERVREKIGQRIEGLCDSPQKQGKALVGELSRYRSLRAVGQRYRILYRVEESKVIVVVVAVGLRREGDKSDVYQLAKKLLKLRLLSDD